MYNIKMIAADLSDQELVKMAVSLIKKRGELGRHHIACALKTTDEQIFLGIHLSANIGVGSICAEAAAIAEAQKGKHTLIKRIVSVRLTFDAMQTVEIIPPCGQCRQLILEYGPDALIILGALEQLILLSAKDLLPFPFIRRKSKQL